MPPRSPLPTPVETSSARAQALMSHLAALHIADSGFPSGRYTLSHGLEALAQSGRLTGSEGLSRLPILLADCIRHGVAPSDGVALACAHRATRADGLDLAAVVDADERLTAAKIAQEARTTSTRTGRALLRTAEAAFPLSPVRQYLEHVRAGQAPGNHAVVFGVLAAALGVQRTEAVVGELYAFAAGWLSAATRLALIDHRTAQVVLFRVHPLIIEAAQDTAARTATQIGSCTPLLDAMSMRHEQAQVRMFAS